jgi:hypothetical protein
VDAHLLQTDISHDGNVLGVSYMLHKAGDCILDVGLANLKVQGSPFSVQVKPASAAASSSTAQGAGLVKTVIGVESAFVVTARDTFGNLMRRYPQISHSSSPKRSRLLRRTARPYPNLCNALLLQWRRPLCRTVG